MEKNELAKKMANAIEEFGLKMVKDNFFAPMEAMVRGSRMKDKFGPARIIAVGFETINPDALTEINQMILDVIPDGDEKTQMQEVFDYWVKHRERIMEEHHVTCITH
jgi:hypothetical protein